jgi:hypothetical protein
VRFFDKYYAVLGLSPDANEREVKGAYRRMAKLYHPDRSGSADTRHKFIEVNEAYEILMKRDAMVRDAIRRYQQRRAGQTPKTPPRSNPRERASTYADMKYSEFVKSPIYRTAMVMDSAFDYIFLFLGFLMILAPVLGYLAESMEENPEKKEAEFHILPILLGLAFLYGVWYFLFKSKRTKE